LHERRRPGTGAISWADLVFYIIDIAYHITSLKWVQDENRSGWRKGAALRMDSQRTPVYFEASDPLLITLGSNAWALFVRHSPWLLRT
jgi:hypothetical protein